MEMSVLDAFLSLWWVDAVTFCVQRTGKLVMLHLCMKPLSMKQLSSSTDYPCLCTDLCCSLSGVRQRSESEHGWTEEERKDKRKEQNKDQQGCLGPPSAG